MSTEYNEASSFSIGEWKIKLNTTVSRPKRAIVELTMKCNLNCTYCFRKVCSGPFGSMDEKPLLKL